MGAGQWTVQLRLPSNDEDVQKLAKKNILESPKNAQLRKMALGTPTATAPPPVSCLPAWDLHLASIFFLISHF